MRGFELKFIGKNGAPSRTRTSDLRITNALLYQLSYWGTRRKGLRHPLAWRLLTDYGLRVQAKIVTEFQGPVLPQALGVAVLQGGCLAQRLAAVRAA